MPPQLEKNHVVPTAWQDEALARDGVSRGRPGGGAGRESLGLFVRRGEDPPVNGQWREWISCGVQEKRRGRKDLADQGCLTSCFQFNKHLLFSSFVGGDVRCKKYRGQFTNESGGHRTFRGRGEHHPGPKRRPWTPRRRRV